jgi:6-phosphogluconolactonase/glucosamine-6-phosphate isomerase/deaminase
MELLSKIKESHLNHTCTKLIPGRHNSSRISQTRNSHINKGKDNTAQNNIFNSDNQEQEHLIFLIFLLVKWGTTFLENSSEKCRNIVPFHLHSLGCGRNCFLCFNYNSQILKSCKREIQQEPH